MVAARQLLRARNPALLARGVEQWDAWIAGQRRQAMDAGQPRLILVAALTCIDDLPLHAGLLQLLATKDVRCRVVFSMPTQAAAKLLRAQARREGWHLFVQILHEPVCDRVLRGLPATETLGIFRFPTALDLGAEPQLWDILQLARQTAAGFIGPAEAYPPWCESVSAAEPDFASALRELLTLDPARLPLIGNRPDLLNCEAAVGKMLPAIPIIAGGVDILQSCPGDQLVLSTTSGDAVGRLSADLHDPTQPVCIRMPASFLTEHPQPLSLELQAIGGIRRTDVSFHIPSSRLRPWMISAFLNRGGAGNSVIRAFAEAIGCRIAYAEDEPDQLSDIPVVWGVLRDSDRILAQARAQHLYFFYIDHAYFSRGHGRAYRITRNGYEAGPVRRCPDDRLRAHGVEMAPWRTGGRDIILCPPTEYFMRAHGCADWLDSTIEQLRSLTDRPIIVREKPKPGEQAVPLPKALESAHALVTHSSNVAIEAAYLGTPVFVSPASAAAPIGRTTLNDIEAPLYPDREAWLAHLAYNQFSFDEIRDGSAWRMLLELEERDLV